MNKMELFLNIGIAMISLSVMMFFIAFLMSNYRDNIKVYILMFMMIFTTIGVADVIKEVFRVIRKLI